MSRIDPIQFRFRLIKWSVFIASVALPLLTWLIATEAFGLAGLSASGATVAALFVSLFVLRATERYLAEGFARSYADASNWDYLSARFGVHHAPTDLLPDRRWTGFGRLDREDVLFETESGVTNDGLYANFRALGRVFIPWKSVAVLMRDTVRTDSGLQRSAVVVLNDADARLEIPWDEAFAPVLPDSVGLT